jgi:hypothetical protein
MRFKKTIELSLEDLKALFLCVPEFDVRFYLCGIHINSGKLESTNGHIALICEDKNSKGVNIIIPRYAIKSFLKKKSFFNEVFLHKIDSEYWLLQCGENLEIFKPLDGVFPNIDRIDIEKPDVYEGVYPKLDIKYLNIFSKISKIYNTGHPDILPTGTESQVYIGITDSVHGLLMPMRL